MLRFKPVRDFSIVLDFKQIDFKKEEEYVLNDFLFHDTKCWIACEQKFRDQIQYYTKNNPSIFHDTTPKVGIKIIQESSTEFIDVEVIYPNDIGDFDQNYFVDAKLEISSNHQLKDKIVKWYYTQEGTDGPFQTYEITTDQQFSIWLSDFWDTGRTAKLYQENEKEYLWVFEIVDSPDTTFTISATSVTGTNIDTSYYEIGKDIKEITIIN